MEDFKNNNKVLFIPGWLNSGEMNGYKNSLDIWNKKIDISKNFNADYVITSSAGAMVALYNWNIYKNFKLILINPVISKKNIFKRWLGSMIHEGTPVSFARLLIFFSVGPAFFKIMNLFKNPSLDIINSIPPENLAIIHGENDKYFCDPDLLNSLAKKGFKSVKVKGAGHNYNDNLEKAVRDILMIEGR